MTATVTLEPRLKLTLDIDDLRPGKLNAARRKGVSVACGGFDASVLLRAKGLPTICVGICYKRDADIFTGFLEEQCIAHDFAVSPGNAATDILLECSTGGPVTSIAIPGDPVPLGVVEDYLKKLRHYAYHCSTVMFCDGFHLEDIISRSLEVLKPFGFSVSRPKDGGTIIAEKGKEL
jgi:fructose-1-phosphate kinase PfkB-like protein